MEFFDIHLSYIDNESAEERVVPVPEISGDKLISDAALKAGHAYFVGRELQGKSEPIASKPKVLAVVGSCRLQALGLDRQTKRIHQYCVQLLQSKSKKHQRKYQRGEFRLHDSRRRLTGCWVQ